LFPVAFERMSGRGVPHVGIVVSALLATVLVVISHLGAAGIQVFNSLILMNGIAAAIPYGFSALAQIKWRIADRRAITTSRLVRDLVTAGVALVVSVLFVVYSTNTEATGFGVYEPFVYLLGALLLGVPVFLFSRSRMTAPPPPPPPMADAPEPVRDAP
jgi:basic amino acid/polyamine antiporter, APA family